MSILSEGVAFSGGMCYPDKTCGSPISVYWTNNNSQDYNKAIRFIVCISMKYIKYKFPPSLPYAGSLSPEDVGVPTPHNVGALSALGFMSTMLTINVALSIYHI